MITHKTCTKCKQSKLISEFYKCKQSKDKHRPQCKECLKLYYRQNKEKILNNQQDYYNKNKHKKLKSCQDYYNKNKHKIIQRNIEYNKRKYNNDINFKITNNLRSRLKEAIYGNSKSKPTLKLLGCSIDYLKEHLQQTAIKNGYIDFDINNYSGQEYHIDHIKPCSSFDLSKPKEQERCFHYSNLQILSANDNLKKSNS